MSQPRLRRSQLVHTGYTGILLTALWLMAALMGLLIAGSFGFWLTGGVAFALLLFSPKVPSKWTMQLYGARRLDPRQAPMLFGILTELSGTAGLRRVPALYFIDSTTANAFAVGNDQDPAVAITRGLLSRLTPREMRGVLAHEISHIQHHDTKIMGLAAMLNRAVGFLSLFGRILLIVNLPLFFLGYVSVPWLWILLLLVVPPLATALLTALSRTREFHADLNAAKISRDPIALASALQKLEQNPSQFWRRILLPQSKPIPEWLRSHPDTSERIQRLLNYGERTPRPTYQTRGFGEYQGLFFIPK